MTGRETAFVAGATGYTGRGVVAALCERGARAIAHVRPDSRELGRWRERFEALGAELDTTPWEESAIGATLTKLRPDAVFALLGTTRGRTAADRTEGKDSSYEAVDYGLSVLLLHACEKLEQEPRFVYLSALLSREGTEGSYAHARWKVEQALRKSSLPYTIAQPSFITGPDREEHRPGERITANITDGALRLAGLFGARKLERRYRSMTGRELGSALVRAAFDPAAANRTLRPEDLHPT